MDIICGILLLALLTQACFGVRVTLEGGTTGIVPKTQKEGTSAILSCSASPTSSGGRQPRLEWTYDTSSTSAGTHLVNNGVVTDPASSPRISVQNPYSLVIKDLISSDSGFYECRVEIPGDVPSEDSAKYNFTVLVPPYQQVSCGFPGDLNLTLGQSASFRCQEVVAQAVPSPTYTWYKNGLQLPTSSAGLVIYKNSNFTYSKTTGVLTFASVTSGAEGTYRCKASNAVGEARCAAAKVSTKEAPVPPYQQVSCGFPGDLMLTLGQSASYRCQEVVAQAVPSPTYTWYKNDLELPTSSAGLVIYKNSNFTYSKTTGVLTFASVTPGAAGTYYCKASNEVGEAKCAPAKILTNVGVIVGIEFGVIFGLLLVGVLSPYVL